MVWPAGVSLCTLSIGPVLNAVGEEATLSVIVNFDSPSRVVVHAETGTSALASAGPVEGSGSVRTVSVPHVNQAGFVGPNGAPITMWGYEVSGQATWSGGGKKLFTKRVQPLVGQDSIDLDTVPDGAFVPAVSGPVASVSSVAGLTGPVSAEDLSEKLSVEASPLPAGGTTGQVLAKTSAADGDAGWVDPATGGGSSAWADITDKPDTFPPSAHQHPAEDVEGLAAVATSGDYADLTGRPAIPAAATDVDALPDTTTAADIGGVVGTGVTDIVALTQAAYDALGTKDAQTLYLIVGA